MKTTQLDIETRAIDSIRPYQHNPRKNDQAVEAVARSIQEFGFKQPIVVDGDGVIIVGHTRWKAAKKLGLELVPVHLATDLSPEQVRAYRLADNKSSEAAEWEKQHRVLTRKDRMGSRVERARFGWERASVREV